MLEVATLVGGPDRRRERPGLAPRWDRRRGSSERDPGAHEGDAASALQLDEHGAGARTGAVDRAALLLRIDALASRSREGSLARSGDKELGGTNR